MPYVCGLCRKVVETLQTNSHIIPRWMMKLNKTNGPPIKITSTEVSYDQNDPKADIVCVSCERLFGKDDKFAEKIFKHSNGLIQQQIVTKDMQKQYLEMKTPVKVVEFSIEDYEPDLKRPLVRFIASVVLRNHLYQRQLNNFGTLGSRFEKLAQLYLDDEEINQFFPVTYYRYNVLPGVHSLPIRTRIEKRIYQELVLSGWRVFMRTDSNHHPELDQIAWNPRFVVSAFENDHKYVKNLAILLANGERKGALKRQ